VKRFAAASILAASFLAFPGAGFAEDAPNAPHSPRFTLGAHADFGVAGLIGEPGTDYEKNAGPRFAGAGGGYLDWYLNPHVALELGVGSAGRGYRYRVEFEDTEPSGRTLFVRTLEIPLGVKLGAGWLELTVALALEVGLSDETKTEGGSRSFTFDESFWKWNRRFNFGPQLALGVPIPIGSRFRIVPGIAASIDLLDESACGKEDYCGFTSDGRYANVAFRLGVEWGFDGRDAARVLARPPMPARGTRPFAVGAYTSFGMSRSVGTNGAAPGIDDWEGGEIEPRFVAGGGAYFDWYLSRMFALDWGVGFVGKGYRYEAYDHELRLTYLELPVGVKLDLKGVRLGVALALEVALTAEEQEATDGDEDDISGWGQKDWDEFRRVNFGPVVTLGYAIPAGSLAFVPGVAWSMDILDDLETDAYGDGSWRNMNVMFGLGIEFGFGGGDAR
jgi:hypothetical protein